MLIVETQQVMQVEGMIRCIVIVAMGHFAASVITPTPAGAMNLKWRNDEQISCR